MTGAGAGGRRAVRVDRPLPGPWVLRNRLLASLGVASSGVWTATHDLPQRAVPTRTGENVVMAAGGDGRPGTLTYTLRVGVHPGLDPALAAAALERVGAREDRRRSSNALRYALVGAGTCWDDGDWSYWIAAGGNQAGYRLYRRPVGSPREGPGSSPPELLALAGAAVLEMAVRDAVSGALRDGIGLARLGADRDWRPLSSRTVRVRDSLAERADVARQDTDAARAGLTAAQSDLKLAAGVTGSARTALQDNLLAAGRTLDGCARRRDDLLAQVAARGPDGEPPDEFGCELDLLLAGLRLLGSGRPQPARAVLALHDVLRVRLRTDDFTVGFSAHVRVLADDGLVADLGPVVGQVANRVASPGQRTGPATRRSAGESARDNATRRAAQRERLDPVVTERLMLTDADPRELARVFRADARWAGRSLGTGLRNRALDHLQGLGLTRRACMLVLDDPVAVNRAAVWQALTGTAGTGPRGLYDTWVVAVYTAPEPAGPDRTGGGHLLPGAARAGTPAGRAYDRAVSALPPQLVHHLVDVAARRGGQPLPRQNQWLRTAPAAQRAIDRAANGQAETSRAGYVTAAVLRSDDDKWPRALLPGPDGSLSLPVPCPHDGCEPGASATFLSRTATVTAGLLCPACLRMPVEGSPVWPVAHVAVSQPSAWSAWLLLRRPDDHRPEKGQ